MVAMGTTEIPGKAVLLLALIGGTTAAARTVQQALKATPETSAALTGNPSSVKTETIVTTP